MTLYQTRKQKIATLQKYRFFKVLKELKPLNHSVYNALPHNDTPKTRAFCDSIKNLLYGNPTTPFLQRFYNATVDCRTMPNKQKTCEALWAVLLVFLRRLPCTLRTHIAVTSIAIYGDYTEMAHAFLNSLNFEPIEKILND